LRGRKTGEVLLHVRKGVLAPATRFEREKKEVGLSYGGGVKMERIRKKRFL